MIDYLKQCLTAYSIRAKVIIGLLLVSFFACFSLVTVQLLIFNVPKISEIYALYEQEIAPKIILEMKQTGGLSELHFDDSAYLSALNIRKVLVVDLEAKVIAQTEHAPLFVGDIGAQLPLQVRDDLTDALLAHYNSGVEMMADDVAIFTRALTDHQGKQLGAVVMWIDNWSAVGSLPSSLLSQWVSFLPFALIVAGFILCCGAIVMWLVGSRIQKRLKHFNHVTLLWGQGRLTERLTIDGADELEQSFEKLNRLVEQLDIHIKQEQETRLQKQRIEFAGELHDTVKQLLFANNLNLSSCQTLAHSEAQLSLLLKQAQSNNQQAFEQVNRILQVQTEHESSAQAYVEMSELTTYLACWKQQTGRDLEVKKPQSGQISSYLFASIKEGLQNISKHSDADTIRLCLELNDGESRFSLFDNGTAQFNPSFGQGLEIIKQKLHSLGGRLSLEQREDDSKHKVTCLTGYLPSASKE
ncbi:histidine kinase [Pseudoalteromonas sp. MTN2-4]|uniref:histidine kinase n=1 Tax=Pseudoalteromonas sp. MTN2-4 TaxID=3056555 RepID=UPI0036F33F57